MGDAYKRRQLRKLHKEIKSIQAQEKELETGRKLEEKLKNALVELKAKKDQVKAPKPKVVPKTHKSPLSAGS